MRGTVVFLCIPSSRFCPIYKKKVMREELHLVLQVQIGSHSFTFDHVFGSTGIPLAEIYDRCVAPLVDGLFHGYNATVLAYGQA